MIGLPAERAVIGAVLYDSRCYEIAAKEIKHTDFSDGQLGDIWLGISKMIAARESVDVITVGANLKEWSIRAVTEAELHLMIGEVPHSLSVAGYAKSVRNESIRRQIRTVSRVMLESVDGVGINPPESLARAINSLRDIQVANTRNELEAKFLSDVLDGVDNYDWVIPNLIERRDRLILTGAEGAGKSTFVRQLAILSSAGIHPLTFKPIDAIKVLVVDAENSEMQWRRAAREMAIAAKAFGSGNPGMNVKLACSPRLDITRDSHIGQIHRLIDDFQPEIVVIGPLYRLISTAINSDDDAAQLLTALDTIRDRNIALVMEAHAGHALGIGGERDLRPRGSAALMGWPEFGLGIRPVRDDPNLYSLIRWRGDRDQREWPQQLRRNAHEYWPWVPSNHR